MPLIQTKTLIPKERKHLLHRPRLVDFLHEHIDRQLILVAASAGYGKTSLLIDYAGDTDLPVCWYSLDESDRSLRDFLEYFVLAIEQVFPERLPETRRALRSWSEETQGEALATVLVNEIHDSIPDYFVLVLDDYHLVDDVVGINLFLDAFLRHQPDNCRLIISSRSIPTLTPRGMALLVAKQQVAGLGVSDLRFTSEEIRDLIRQSYGEEMTLEQAEELARESEGWITAILLTRHRMWKGLLAGMIRDGAGAVGLYDYLANEVFERLDEDRRWFLEATSLLTFMSPALCDALLGRDDSQVQLEQLEDRNLFTTRVERGSQVWYRYHRLFREFLRAKLARRGAGQEIALHIRAARYLEEDGNPAEAIQHYLEAGAYRDAARVIEQVAAESYDAGRLDALLYWIDALPQEILRQTPRLAWFKAKILWNRNALQESLRYSEEAYTGFKRLGSPLGSAQALLEKAAVLRLQGNLRDSLSVCEQALGELEGQTVAGKDLVVLGGIYRNQGIAQVQMGSIGPGIEKMREALSLYEQGGNVLMVAQTHSDLGVGLRQAGNLSASHYHFEQALKIWEREQNTSGIASALNSIGVSYHVRGNYEKALDIYEIALQRAREAASDRLSGVILAGMGDTYVALGDLDRAIDAYRQSQPLAERAGYAFLTDYLLGALAFAHLLRGEATLALDKARQAYETAVERGARQEAAAYQIVLGAVYYQQGRSRRALDCLGQAVIVLRESRAFRDLARAQLHLAQAYYRAGRVSQAQDALEELTDTILDVGQDQFLIPEARLALPLLEYAVGHGIGGQVLGSLLERARAQVRTTQPAESTGEVLSDGTAMPPLRIHALGEVRCFRGDEEIPPKAWGAVKARQLLLYLLSHPGQSKEQLGALFWPDLPPAKVRSAFHVTMYRLRRALQTNEAVLFDDEKYHINHQLKLWYDVREFERLLDEADALDKQDLSRGAERRREAIELVRGEFCTGLPDMEWQALKREELNRRYLGALVRLADYHLQQGSPGQALEYYRRAMQLDNLREDIHRGMMRCLAALGDRAGALKHYREMSDVLLDEMGADPDPETTRLYQEIAWVEADELE